MTFEVLHVEVDKPLLGECPFTIAHASVCKGSLVERDQSELVAVTSLSTLNDKLQLEGTVALSNEQFWQHRGVDYELSDASKKLLEGLPVEKNVVLTDEVVSFSIDDVKAVGVLLDVGCYRTKFGSVASPPGYVFFQFLELDEDGDACWLNSTTDKPTYMYSRMNSETFMPCTLQVGSTLASVSSCRGCCQASLQALAMATGQIQTKLQRVWGPGKPYPCYVTRKVIDGRVVTVWGNPQYIQISNVAGMAATKATRFMALTTYSLQSRLPGSFGSI
jgi:hypothetical protein